MAGFFAQASPLSARELSLSVTFCLLKYIWVSGSMPFPPGPPGLDWLQSQGPPNGLNKLADGGHLHPLSTQSCRFRELPSPPPCEFIVPAKKTTKPNSQILDL